MVQKILLFIAGYLLFYFSLTGLTYGLHLLNSHLEQAQASEQR